MKKGIVTIVLAVLMLPAWASFETKDSKKVKETPEATVLMGTVVDQSTGEVLPGVQIKISGLDQTIYTDFNGNFEVQDMKPGSYNLEISLVSYSQNKIKDLVVSANKKSALKVELKR